MNKSDILDHFKQFTETYHDILKHDKKLAVVAGPACVLHGVRETCSDIDLQVSRSSYEALLPHGKVIVSVLGTARSERLQLGVFDIMVTDYQRINVDGIPVQRIKCLRKMKERLYLQLNRRKDLEDLQKIRVLI